MRAFMLLAIAVLGSSATACADGQGAYVSSAAQRFTPGTTTRAETIASLGPPSSIYRAANGETTLAWARDGGLFNPGETRQYALVFGPDDKMIRVATAP